LQAKLSALDICYSGVTGDKNCWKDYLEFARRNKTESGWLRTAAETVSRRQGPVAALGYYQVLIEGDARGSAICDEPLVHQAVLAGLSAKKSEGYRIALDLGEGLCWHTVRGDLEKELQQSRGTPLRAAACQIFRGKNLLAGVPAGSCGPKERDKP
jgi:hypothetical protein